MSQQQPLTNVSAVGVAEADYDVVRFSITIEGKGKTGPASKEDARPGIDAVTEAIAALEKEGIDVDRAHLKATTSTRAETKYDRSSGEQKPNGYKTTYEVSFSSTSVDKASAIHDCLTSIPNAQVQEPDFKVQDILGLQRKALIDAKEKVDARFDDQCAILGIDERACSLASYRVDYDESESAGARPMRASLALMSATAESAGGGGPPPVEIKAGKARVKATLTISYQRKAPSARSRKKAQPSAQPTGGNGSKSAAPRAASTG